MKKVILFLLSCLTYTSYAQDSTSIDFRKLPRGNDLKVGLVLSGGGAKGLAHIGVLKELEEAGIKIDFIGGTSMGAIVGGLYAAGYNAHQLDSIFKVVNFEKLIQDDIPRSAQSFQERTDAEKFALSLPFDHFKVSFPSALSKGQNVYNLFIRLTHHVEEVDDFSKLEIPFFCVATDAEKGEAILLDNGCLAEAISASGALPSIFSPVILDGQLLIDGGVVNNYPVEELRRRGANFIIGVDVQDDLRDKEELKTAPEMLVQINNYRTINAMKEKAELTDIYIKPNIEGYTVMDFEKGAAIIEEGNKKAQEFAGDLKKLAALQDTLYRKPPALINQGDTLRIRSVAINGNTYYTRSYILGKLKIKLPAEITYDKLFEGINNLAATNNFERINHRLEKYDSGQYHLVLNLNESESTTYLKAGLHYDDIYKSAAIINITKKRALFKNDIASLSVGLGDNIRYDFDYYSDNGFYLGFGLKSRYNSFETRVDARFIEQLSDLPLESFNSLTVDYMDITNQIYLQTLFQKQFALRIGIEHKFLEIDTESVRLEENPDSKVYFDNSHYFSAYGNLLLDTFDNKYFPTSGWYFNGDFNLYLFSSDYNNNFEEFSLGSAQLKYAASLSSRVAMVFGVEGGFKIGGTSVNTLDYVLGGWGNDFINNIVSFYGYDYVSLTGDGLVKSEITFDYNFYKKHHLNVGANIANIENDLFTTGNWLSAPNNTGYFLGYGLETLVGPLQTKLSYSPEIDKVFWNFSLGFWF
ncbi:MULTISPECIES: patatin-like phospholipase family protein [unclassified Leeuwenhoekiella]|uniref:patatin-like phospholipase family protein n=1 Tax=unclassified Leeuwenhoekiella TaxID=2615029 RepID=UPI000C6461F9|nr:MULTISPECIES: patatin-like phospholipase family protein [unclassified Leeuwenhoekiella]MAW95811.1 patatin [Leeuwenhoekiella sp.]MBA82918.1 patatin [Leeuwenhoekiella sp.]|tara:strand:- start:31696 stop:33957 length:2262 start_codon:yes stop_codon:yes gene_type:complete